MAAPDLDRDAAHRAYLNAERLKRLSDRLIGVGPFGVGLDGALAFVPVANTVYSAGAGAWVLWQGIKAKASPATLARMAAYVAADTLLSEVPIVGWAVDLGFQGHLFAAGALQKDIVRRHGPPPELLRDVTPRTQTA